MTINLITPSPIKTDFIQPATWILTPLCWLMMSSISPYVIAQNQLTAIEITYTSAIPSQLAKNIELASSAVKGLQQCEEISELAFNQVQQAIGNSIIESTHSFGYFASKVNQLSLPQHDMCNQWLVDVTLGEPAQIANIQLTIDGDLEASNRLSCPVHTSGFKRHHLALFIKPNPKNIPIIIF